MTPRERKLRELIAPWLTAERLAQVDAILIPNQLDELGLTPKQRAKVEAILEFWRLRKEGWDARDALEEVAETMKRPDLKLKGETIIRVIERCNGRDDLRLFEIAERLRDERATLSRV